MVSSTESLQILLVLGVAAAFAALVYFLFRGLQQDHETGEYHFTWAVGIVALFLLGFAPGIVGFGLYLTVERGYPIHWLVVCLLVVFVVLAILGLGVYSTSTTTVVSDESPAWIGI
ncbi:hypothetical protein OB955_13265 [Halobacteria archaeon AArc-m2/3/4]|uniref:Uncharacterized protein n=1 Tax=Natronoglomus mannanivorans TaxID=2979990 RepID=A0AAP2YXT0_9EURY|nr:hypothetical protein [Halobacteria archaeon AArc-xg1-1]MCU4973704.1 hypothetical protein [Halobacteria archaeon AArc-m2/3/4]